MNKSITDILKQAIQRSLDDGQTFYGLERDTGVLRQSLMKFMKGETSLRLDIADKLADHFGLVLQQKEKS